MLAAEESQRKNMPDLKIFPYVRSTTLLSSVHGNGDAIQRQGGDGRRSRLYPAVHCPKQWRQPLDAFPETLPGLGLGAAQRGASGHGVSGVDASSGACGTDRPASHPGQDRQSFGASPEAFLGRDRPDVHRRETVGSWSHRVSSGPADGCGGPVQQFDPAVSLSWLLPTCRGAAQVYRFCQGKTDCLSGLVIGSPAHRRSRSFYRLDENIPGEESISYRLQHPVSHPALGSGFLPGFPHPGKDGKDPAQGLGESLSSSPLLS